MGQIFIFQKSSLLSYEWVLGEVEKNLRKINRLIIHFELVYNSSHLFEFKRKKKQNSLFHFALMIVIRKY